MSTPTSDSQGELYNRYGGMLEQDIHAMRCGTGGTCPRCSLHNIAGAEEACGGRSMAEKQANPVPAYLLEVDRESYIGVATAAAAAVHRLLPFTE